MIMTACRLQAYKFVDKIVKIADFRQQMKNGEVDKVDKKITKDLRIYILV